METRKDLEPPDDWGGWKEQPGSAKSTTPKFTHIPDEWGAEGDASSVESIKSRVSAEPPSKEKKTGLIGKLFSGRASGAEKSEKIRKKEVAEGRKKIIETCISHIADDTLGRKKTRRDVENFLLNEEKSLPTDRKYKLSNGLDGKYYIEIEGEEDRKINRSSPQFRLTEKESNEIILKSLKRLMGELNGYQY